MHKVSLSKKLTASSHSPISHLQGPHTRSPIRIVLANFHFAAIRFRVLTSDGFIATDCRFLKICPVIHCAYFHRRFPSHSHLLLQTFMLDGTHTVHPSRACSLDARPLERGRPTHGHLDRGRIWSALGTFLHPFYHYHSTDRLTVL